MPDTAERLSNEVPAAHIETPDSIAEGAANLQDSSAVEALQSVEVNIDQQDLADDFTALASEQKKIFTHTLEDGREFSGTHEQAMKLCPYIGKMSTENARATLNDADMAQRVIAERRANRLAEEQNSQQNKENNKHKSGTSPNDNEQQSKELPGTVVLKPDIQDIEQQLVAARTPTELLEPTSAQITERIRLQEEEARRFLEIENTEEAKARETVDLSFKPAKTETASDDQADAVPQFEESKRKPDKSAIDVLDTRTAEQETTKYTTRAAEPTSQTPDYISDIAATVETEPTITSGDYAFDEPAKDIARYQVPAEDNELRQEHISEFMVADEAEATIISDNSEKALPEDAVVRDIEVDLEPMEKIDIDELTVETYHQLLALDELIASEALVGTAESDLLEDVESALHANADSETADDYAVKVKDYFESQPRPEEAINIETIKISAADQTLEETFIQLASYLTEAANSENGKTLAEVTPEDKKVRRLLSEIEKELARPDENDLEKTKQLRITPEITQKLLALLQAVGYENPQETLLEFVSNHSLEFLLQTIRYLYQLTNEDNQHELHLFKIPALSALADDDPISKRLGRTIIDLLKLRLGTPLKAATQQS